jgi:hypothetical protein
MGRKISTTLEPGNKELLVNVRVERAGDSTLFTGASALGYRETSAGKLHKALLRFRHSGNVFRVELVAGIAKVIHDGLNAQWNPPLF